MFVSVFVCVCVVCVCMLCVSVLFKVALCVFFCLLLALVVCMRSEDCFQGVHRCVLPERVHTGHSQGGLVQIRILTVRVFFIDQQTG